MVKKIPLRDGNKLEDPGCLLRLLEDAGNTKCPRHYTLRICKPATAFIRGQRLFHSAPPIVWRLFEGGVYSRKYGRQAREARHIAS